MARHHLHLLYHGNCFDGVVSAGIFTRFYLAEGHPGARVTFRGMAHGQGDPFGPHPETTFEGDDNAVVDFRYHPSPRLTWWCDHHATSFIAPEHEATLAQRDPGRFCFDPKAPSCGGLLARWLGERYGFSFPLQDALVREADRIDAARFGSPEEAVALADPALRLATVLESAPGPELSEQLIQEVTRRPLAQVAALPGVVRALGPVLDAHRRNQALFQAHMELRDGVALVDLSAQGVEGFNKFIPYAIHPDLRYTVVLTASRRRTKVSVGSNPWNRPDPLVDLGALCKRHGGGGHPVVGAVTLPPGQEAEGRRVFNAVAATLTARGG